MFYSNALTFNDFFHFENYPLFQPARKYTIPNESNLQSLQWKICIYSVVLSLLPTSKWCSSPNLAVPGIEGGPNSPQTVASSKRPRQRRDWTDTETSLLWELYETAYSLGKLTSKATKANSGGWENLEKDFNRELASRNMVPRTLQQMKKKINNLNSDHKKIKDKESQTGQETQAKPFWFDMVDRVFGSKDEIEPPFLFDSTVKADTKIKERPQIERKTRVT